MRTQKSFKYRHHPTSKGNMFIALVPGRHQLHLIFIFSENRDSGKTSKDQSMKGNLFELVKSDPSIHFACIHVCRYTTYNWHVCTVKTFWCDEHTLLTIKRHFTIVKLSCNRSQSGPPLLRLLLPIMPYLERKLTVDFRRIRTQIAVEEEGTMTTRLPHYLMLHVICSRAVLNSFKT